MLFKFSPSALTKGSSLRRSTVLIWLFATLQVATTPAQTPTPSPSPTPKPPRAYVRFWNMLPSQPPVTLELLYTNRSISTAASCNFYAGYFPVLPGAFEFTVRRANDQNGSIKRVSVNLKANDFVTILVSNKDGQPNVELVNDTVDPKAPNPNRLVLRQLFPNAKVTAFLGTTPASGALGYGETIALDNLAAAQSNLTVQAVIPGQGVKSWSMPLDLTQAHHSTLLIFPDPYGRFRPRLAADAQAAAESERGEGR